MTTTATTSTTLAMSPVIHSPSPSSSHKRKRSSESPFSTRSGSPTSMDGGDEDEDDGASSSTTATSTPSRQTNKTKTKSPMDPVRAARLEARAARNRVSAQHSRDRKKNHVVHLETEVTQLRAEKEELTTRIKALEDLVKTLLGATATGAAKEGVEPSSTMSVPTSPSASLSLLSTSATTDAFNPSSLCITPQALSQRATEFNSLAAPTSSTMTALPASSFPDLPLVSTTTPNDLTINDARLPAAGIIDVESGQGGEERKQERNRMQVERLDEPVNGSSSDKTKGTQWIEGKSSEQQGSEGIISKGNPSGLGEENNWLAQYLEGMLESVDYQEDTLTYTGEESQGQQQQGGKRSQDQDGEIGQQDGLVMGGVGLSTDEMTLQSLLSVDQLIDVDMDIEEEEGLPFLDVIKQEFGLGLEVNV